MSFLIGRGSQPLNPAFGGALLFQYATASCGSENHPSLPAPSTAPPANVAPQPSQYGETVTLPMPVSGPGQSAGFVPQNGHGSICFS